MPHTKLHESESLWKRLRNLLKSFLSDSFVFKYWSSVSPLHGVSNLLDWLAQSSNSLRKSLQNGCCGTSPFSSTFFSPLKQTGFRQVGKGLEIFCVHITKNCTVTTFLQSANLFFSLFLSYTFTHPSYLSHFSMRVTDNLEILKFVRLEACHCLFLSLMRTFVLLNND